MRSSPARAVGPAHAALDAGQAHEHMKDWPGRARPLGPTAERPPGQRGLRGERGSSSPSLDF